MSELLREKADRLIVGGAKTTEGGRLDFPDRLPFCPDQTCRASGGCVFRKLWIYLKNSGRLFEGENIAIGKCNSLQLKDIRFPDLYSPLDDYSEDYYVEEILPVIILFYEGGLEELFKRI